MPGIILSPRIHMVDIANKSSCLCRGYIPVKGDTWKQWKEFLKSYEVLENNKWHEKDSWVMGMECLKGLGDKCSF